jgi:hypothetical protein
VRPKTPTSITERASRDPKRGIEDREGFIRGIIVIGTEVAAVDVGRRSSASRVIDGS